MRAVAVGVVFLSVLGCRAATAAAPRVPDFDHVFVVVFENKESSRILGNRDAPTFNLYSRVYATMTRSYGITHPSLPNYLALVGGSTFGITTDCTDCMVDGRSLADTIEASGRTWKTYAEGLPAPGFLGAEAGRYVKRHNPFAYFRAVAGDPQRSRRIVPITQFAADRAAGRLPDFALVVPNLCNSMHDCSVQVGDAWLRRTVAPLLKLPRTVIFVTFDEGVTRVRGGGHITTLAVGTAVRRHVRFRGITNHYGLLRTIETSWGLPLLGRSPTARPITGIFR